MHRIAMIASAAVASVAAAQSVSPFTETFNDGVANWLDTGFAPLTLVPNGGPDGSAAARAGFDFVNTNDGDFSVLFRGENDPTFGFDASGGAFIGDYISSGITEVSFDIRHNANVPLSFFVRLATPQRFPGAVAVAFAPVVPGEFQRITLDISESSPNFVTFEGSDFQTVLGNVGLLQIGVVTPDGFGGVDAGFTFDLDNVAIVPTPAAASLLGLAGLAAVRRRR